MAIGTLIGALGALILGAYGVYKQEKEAERGRREYGRQVTQEEERYGTGLQLHRGEIRRQEREARKAWAWKEEERDYSRAQDFVKNFNSLIDDPRQGSADLFNVWSRRAA